VLGAGFATTLVTADVTLSVWLTTADVEGLGRAGGLARALAAQIRIWTPVQQRIFTGMGGTLAPDNAAFLHDPLTVLALIDATPLRFETLRIATTIERGVLRTHELPGRAGVGSEMRVATAVDAARAARAIVDRIASA
jgi:inosine-uridine nucleoside N-ribohydrolase